MSPLGQFPKVAFPLLALALTFFAACDSGGGMNGDDNRAPSAEITASTTEPVVGDTVNLDASGSSDPDGDDLKFTWTLNRPDGSNVVLSSQTSSTTSFVPDTNVTYTAAVEVSDGSLSDEDEVDISAREDTPGTKDSITVSAEAVTDNGARIDSARILFDGTEVGTGYAQQTYAEDPDREVTVRSEEDDYESAEATASLGSDHDLSLEMLEKLPETVTVPFENVATDGDSLVAHTISWNDSVVVASAAKSGTAEIPASREEGELCAQENDLFNEGCISLTPTSDFAETQTIAVDRKTVALTARGDLPYGDVSEAEFSVINPTKDTVSRFTGENTVQLAKLAEGKMRQVIGDLITDDPERENRLDRLYGETSVSAHADTEATVGFETLPACSDNINNEPQEDAELVDEDDPGCLNQDGEYKPDDDNEGHVFVRSIHISTSLPEDDYYMVISSAENNRRAGFPGDIGSDRTLDLPASIIDAVVVGAGVDTERDSTQADETFAATFKCGATEDNLTNVNTSSIVADNNKQHGWAFTEIPGVELDFFRPGPFCQIIYKHGTLVRDEPPGDGKDDVFYLKPDGENRAFVVSFFLEEEDYNSSKNSVAAKRGGANHCSPNNAPCTQTRMNGYPR